MSQLIMDQLREAYETRDLIALGRVVDTLRAGGRDYYGMRDFFIASVGYIHLNDFEDLMAEIDAAEARA